MSCWVNKLRFNHIHVQDVRNWSFELTNPDWWKKVLVNAKNKLNSVGFSFPAVVRHGWNLPPKEIMGFYMSDLGVLADASGVSGGGRNDYLKTFGYHGRTINWRNSTLPYYASLSGDYDKVWSGSEQDRGLLEMPLTFPNFENMALDSKVMAKIKSLSNGALVSTYLHPFMVPWVRHAIFNGEELEIRARGKRHFSIEDVNPGFHTVQLMG